MIFVNEKYLPCFGLINMPLLVCSDVLLERETQHILERVQYIKKNYFLKIIYCILIYLICLVLYFLYKIR